MCGDHVTKRPLQVENETQGQRGTKRKYTILGNSTEIGANFERWFYS